MTEDGEPHSFQVQSSLLSLPWVFGTTLATIPANIPYLSAAPDLRTQWQQRLGVIEGFKVGIAWQGNPQHPLDHRRSVPLHTFTPLAGISGVRLVSLQKGPGREQFSELADRIEVLDLADELVDFADTQR